MPAELLPTWNCTNSSFAWNSSFYINVTSCEQMINFYKLKRETTDVLSHSGNSRCCCNETLPTAEHNLDFLPALQNIHPGKQPSCLQENSVMQYTHKTWHNSVQSACTC